MPQHAELAGGYCKGDQVVSLIDHDNICKGDAGVVTGPCVNETVSVREQRLLVDFGDGKGLLNIIASTQLKHAPLVGGYCKGDKVVSLIDNENICKGDAGVVTGPCVKETLSDREQRLLVDFGDGKGLLNIIASTQLKHAPLAGGYCK